MTMVDPQAIVAGPPLFATISNVQPIPANNAFQVVFDTDLPIQLQVDYWSQNDPSLPQPLAGTMSEAGPATHHVFSSGALPGGANHSGYTFGFSIRKDANDVSNLTLRSYQGFVQLTGARSTRGLSVPVRWNTFGDGTRPAGGGGIGNWSSYTWAQYNPKGSTYPAP